VTEWHAADERNNRDKIDRAREAAEALFKPAGDGNDREPLQATGNNAGSAEPHPEQQPRRQPRIFTIAPRLPATADAEAPPKPKPAPRGQPAQRRRAAVPPSQIGRVRTLATYGMTTAQVAQLYGVAVDEIERILEGSAVNRKSG
jgi:hypothetical protein